MQMTPRERVLAALDLEEPDRVPYCEHSFSQKIAQQLLQSKSEVSEKQICDKLGRANMNFDFRPPVFLKEAPTNKGGRG